MNYGLWIMKFQTKQIIRKRLKEQIFTLYTFFLFACFVGAALQGSSGQGCLG